MGQVQLTMPGGEPRFTKIKGQNRYYDHALSKSISHRQYWKLRGQTRDSDKWTAEKAAALKSPKPVTALPRAESSSSSGPGPSLLARKLLEESMLGSPVVETPQAPPSSAAKEFVNEFADDTKKTVESLAETVTPALAMGLILLAMLLLPAHLGWIAPEQEEAELMLEPAARIVFRTFGITGKALGPNGNDILSLIAAITAYFIGVKSRMDDFLAATEDEEQREQAAVNRSRAPAEHNGRAHTDTPAYAPGASPTGYAAVFSRTPEQANQTAVGQAGAGAPASGRSLATERTAREAASVRELFQADYVGRQRLGLAR